MSCIGTIKYSGVEPSIASCDSHVDAVIAGLLISGKRQAASQRVSHPRDQHIILLEIENLSVSAVAREMYLLDLSRNFPTPTSDT